MSRATRARRSRRCSTRWGAGSTTAPSRWSRCCATCRRGSSGRWRTWSDASSRRPSGDYELPWTLLQTLPGTGPLAAAALLAEVGDDMEAFGTARRLASWAGICPGNHESAGKSKGGKRRKGNVYLRRILCEVAHAAARTHGVQFGPYKQQLAKRRGAGRAVVATAHKILRIVFAMLRSSRGRGALSGYWSAGGMFTAGGRRVGDPPMVMRTDLFGRSCLADVEPECRCNVTRKVTDVRRGDDPVCRPDGRDLGCENDVAIERPVVGSRLASLTSVRPERGCLPHRRSRERQVLNEFDDRIEPSESLLPATPLQHAAYFVICDLRQDDTRTGCDERLKPLGTSQALRRSLRVRHQAQRPGVECDHQTHQVTPLCSVGNN